MKFADSVVSLIIALLDLSVIYPSNDQFSIKLSIASKVVRQINGRIAFEQASLLIAFGKKNIF